MLYFAGLDNSLIAQNFTNPDLTGTNVNTLASLPTGWSNIPATDVVCLTPTTHLGIGDTPDLTTINGPTLSLGIAGNAYSGNSFVSGVKGENFHEGMMQTVHGLIPGKVYKIEFYQSVVKQENCRDTSGAWSVFLDNTLIQNSQLSVSHLAYNNPNLIWEHRTVLFTATSSTHTLKFLPYDDDPFGSTQTQQEDAALRMGIDLITMEEYIIPNAIIDTTLCSQIIYDIQLSEPGASFIWTDGFIGANRSITQEGSYEVAISSNDTLYSITYHVHFFNEDLAQLPADTLLCEGDTLEILSPQNTYSFFWQDGSQNSLCTVTESTLLTYTIYKDYCSYTDTMDIDVFTFNFSVQQDTSICNGDTLFFDLNNNYTYHLNQQTISAQFTIPNEGMYILEMERSQCKKTDTLTVSFFPPLNFTLGNDTSICEEAFYTLAPTSNQSLTNYSWSTGSSEPTINISTAGIYWLTASNLCESVTEEIAISTHLCSTQIYAPNSFSPNMDAHNNTFRFKSDQDFSRFEWRVYNRWGQVIFEGRDQQAFWDGTFNNELCEEGSYAWELTYQLSNSVFADKHSGTLFLIR